MLKNYRYFLKQVYFHHFQLLYFFLPESILNVSTHKNIRNFLLDTHRNIEIFPLGNAFKGVQSECILLKLSEVTKEENRIIVEKDKRYTLNIKNISPPHYLIFANIKSFTRFKIPKDKNFENKSGDLIDIFTPL